MDNSVLMCNEIIEKTILMKKKKNLQNATFLYVIGRFINYHYIIDSC